MAVSSIQTINVKCYGNKTQNLCSLYNIFSTYAKAEKSLSKRISCLSLFFACFYYIRVLGVCLLLPIFMDTMKIEVNGTKKAYEQTELIRFGVISGIYSAIPRRYLLYRLCQLSVPYLWFSATRQSLRGLKAHNTFPLTLLNRFSFSLSFFASWMYAKMIIVIHLQKSFNLSSQT